MPGTVKRETHKNVEKLIQIKNGTKKSLKKRPKVNPKHQKTSSCLSKKMVIENPCEGKGKGSSIGKTLQKAIFSKTKSPEKQSALTCKVRKLQKVDSKKNGENEEADIEYDRLKKRKRAKRRKRNAELDEVSRLHRRTRYLLIKMKLEQNLIDAYSTEGWKGQSREKIKPEKELERAKLQILKCKLGIREAVRQLDLLSSVGHIDDEVIAPDGSVHHEHIICAKCKLRDAFPDNDIILCDGTCNCAFHQKCLDPPLSTENIPPDDEGWFCKLCKIRMEIIESTNVHLGTHFAVDSNWEDIFKEEAALPGGGDSLQCPEHEWPSDDSEDDDYDPEKIENSSSKSTSNRESDDSDDASSSTSLGSLEDELFAFTGRPEKSIGFENNSADIIAMLDSDQTTDFDVLNGPRQRTSVDYIKLNDELFGKNPPMNEQNSEDEDWGPTKRKQKKKEFESDAASTLMTLCENENDCQEKQSTEVEEKSYSGKTRRSIFRIPPNAVEKLRLVFAENELPSKEVKDNLSKQLGLDSEKVNKWFKNARYLALKGRKVEKTNPSKAVSPIASEECAADTVKGKITEEVTAKDMATERAVQTPKNLKRTHRRKSAHKLICKSKKIQLRKAVRQSIGSNKAIVEFGDDMSLKLLRERVKKEKRRLCFNGKGGGELEAEAEMERLCRIKNKVERLQLVLLRLRDARYNKMVESPTPNSPFMYVPVAEIKEKTQVS
ncbi:PREDICTED: pathogenesis-related homeodomain protein isoform X2 [Ipomoea nil]|uniref:pathogenesis-related homeodomain protein isoform X2 n=1 Tax=Ipomoea nil TaxID=35883 RepID=UPI0009017A2D|nr:PREDICTED: pathogenesis-related homeodomain protein isoform X2 [Ipomoea nil]